MNRTRSNELFARACTFMPGGVNSPVRAFKSVGATPIYFREAAGAHFVDEDGNRYADYCLSWGPLILGHAHPAVVEAVSTAACAGLSFGACHRREIELCELVLAAFPGMERARLVSSGTEAVMTAIRLARGATGRPKILKFEGGYHGHSDALLVRAGSGLATFGTSSSLGVPAGFAAETVVCPFDDEAALEEVFHKVGGELAAAILEPLPANNGLLTQRPEWLQKLRALCTQHGALLILDEVISGFRLCFGGYGNRQGIQADLITLGKIIGGGMPVGAILGRQKEMELLAPLGGVYQAGTLSGNPVSLAAGIATLQVLRDGAAYAKLEQLGARLEAALEKEARALPFLRLRREGSVVWPYFAASEPPRRADRIAPEAITRYNRIHAPLLSRGIYLPPSAYEVFFLSTAHIAEDIDALARELTAALKAHAQ